MRMTEKNSLFYSAFFNIMLNNTVISLLFHVGGNKANISDICLPPPELQSLWWTFLKSWKTKSQLWNEHCLWKVIKLSNRISITFRLGLELARWVAVTKLPWLSDNNEDSKIDLNSTAASALARGLLVDICKILCIFLFWLTIAHLYQQYILHHSLYT